MGLKSAQQWSGLIVTKDATGALSAASVGPAGTLYVNGTGNGASVTVSGSNPYKWTVTLPALTAGDLVSMYVTATIDSVATAEVVAEDVADTKRVSDLNDIAAGAAMTISGTLSDLDAIWAKIQKWLRLALRSDAATTTDCATELTELNADGGSGAGAYANTTDAQEAIRDQGDSAWITATGFAEPGDEMDLIDAPNATAITAIQDGLAQTGADSDTLETLSDQIDLQATSAALATAQADLDNPGQYKADVSALALEATAQSILTDTGTTLPTDIAALPTASENADQVWEEAIADHSGTAGSTAEALNAAGAAGDPWNTELPGAYTTGKAGYIIGTTFAGQLTSLINRLGAFTGSGVNTVLGFLQAIMRKDVTTPTDAGGTYDDATDSLEALRDKVDTLPSTTAQTSAASESGAIAAVAYATLAETVSGLSIPADWTKCIFTVKGDLDDADSAALIQIVESNPGVAADGLLYLNGDDPTEESLTAADGSLTVDQAAQTVAIYLTDEAMAVLGFFGGFYDIKTVDADGDTLRQDYGTLDVSETATRATS